MKAITLFEITGFASIIAIIICAALDRLGLAMIFGCELILSMYLLRREILRKESG